MMPLYKKYMHIPSAVQDDLSVYLVDLPDQPGGQHLLRSTGCCDSALFHNVNLIAESRRHIQIVEGGDDCDLKAFYQLQQLQLIRNIQMVGRLVQN